MVVPFFLTPKIEIVTIGSGSTMRQVQEKMSAHTYTAMPVIDEGGKYVGTVTEGDLLQVYQEHPQMRFSESSKILLKDIVLKTINNPVHIDAKIENLLEYAICQNFVPVVDDSGVFIGIVRRREIIEYFAGLVHKYDSAEWNSLWEKSLHA